MKISLKIEKKLLQEFNPTYLKIFNESYKHNVPNNSESHFKVIIVSDYFNNQNILIRHKSIYQTIQEELKQKIYAITLNVYTVQEWNHLHSNIYHSPCCYNAKK